MTTRRLAWLLLLWLPACDGAPPAPESAGTLARVDGEPITRADVTTPIAFELYRRELDVDRLLRRELERQVEQRLLAKAAAREGLTPEQLLDREVSAGLPPVTDAEVDAYRAAHPNELPDATARPRIRHYLAERRREERRLAFLSELRASAEVEILLARPVAPRVEVPLEGAPSRGPADAPVTVVLFASLTHPDAVGVVDSLARLREELGDRLRGVFRHHPRERDELSLRAARLAVVASRSGRFWELHDRLLFGTERDEAALVAAARELDLAGALAGLESDVASLRRVRADLAHARRLGVRRGPTLFVNGRYFMGLYPEAELRALVAEELAAAGQRQAKTG